MNQSYQIVINVTLVELHIRVIQIKVEIFLKKEFQTILEELKVNSREMILTYQSQK